MLNLLIVLRASLPFQQVKTNTIATVDLFEQMVVVVVVVLEL